MVKIREYQSGDSVKIFNLLSSFTGYKRDAAFWVWINRMLSDEKAIISIAESGNEIIGHYAVIPRICKIVDNCELNCGLGIHAFVHPSFRNTVSIYSISGLVYQIAASKNFDFIYGFPNSNYRLIQEKIERWKKISLFNAFVKPLIKSKRKKLNFEWERIEEEKCDYDTIFIINELLEKSDFSGKISFTKSLTYFLNRYLRHPQKLYQNWFLKKEGKPIGVIITKLFVDKEVKVHIIDNFLSSKDYLADVIDDFESVFCETASSSVLWPNSSYFSGILFQKGYTQTGFDTFFGIKFLSEKAILNQDILLDFNEWNLCMGDSDAF